MLTVLISTCYTTKLDDLKYFETFYKECTPDKNKLIEYKLYAICQVYILIKFGLNLVI